MVDESVLAHEGEALGVHGTGLNQELVSPAVKGVETLGVVDVVDENTAVSTTVECNTERLESFLSCSVPKLLVLSDAWSKAYLVLSWYAHLHGD